MLRMRPLHQAGLRSTSQGERRIRVDVGAFYIGLGDQFDDDRRLVHEITPGGLVLGAAFAFRSGGLSSRLRTSTRGSTA